MSGAPDRSAAPARWAALFDQAAGELHAVSPAVAHRCSVLAGECRRLAEIYRQPQAVRISPAAISLGPEAAALLLAIDGNAVESVALARAAERLGVGVRGHADLRSCLRALKARGMVWATSTGRLERTGLGNAALVQWKARKGGK